MSYSQNTLVMRQPSSSGQIMDVTTGCSIRDKNVSVSTGGNISNHGFTVVNTTVVSVVAAPVLGCRKEILFQGTTKQMAIRTAGATINNSIDDVVLVTLTSATGAQRGYGITLHGASSSLWYMNAGAAGRSTQSQATVSLTSTT